jgi:hypothetical protein
MRSASGTIALIQNNPDEIRLLLGAFRRESHPCPVQVLTDGEECLAYLAGAGKYQDRSRYPVPSDLNGLARFFQFAKTDGHEGTDALKNVPPALHGYSKRARQNDESPSARALLQIPCPWLG